jgi:hypothetical protein
MDKRLTRMKYFVKERKLQEGIDLSMDADAGLIDDYDVMIYVL